MMRALEEKMERYHALRDGLSADDAIRNDIDVILGRASAAMRLARSAPETANAEAVLKRHAAEAAAAVQRAPRPPSVLVPQPVAPAATPAPAAPPPGDALPDALGGPTPPYGTPIALPPPAETGPVASAPKPSAAGRPVPPAEQSYPPGRGPDQSINAAGPGASGFEGRAQIEHLLMEGEVRMTVADYANAVKVYDKLVRLAPQVAAFHLRFAVAMACYPRTAKLAEREFYEAARIEPDNAEVHYQWGLYYKVMKIKSRAVAEMRTAVRLNPKHKAARAELEQLSPKDSALTSLKKLFR
jgi:tetratricopeptide (TPR) repeat protein